MTTCRLFPWGCRVAMACWVWTWSVCPAEAGPFADALARFQQAEAAGFRWTSADSFPGAFTAMARTTDEGPMGVPLLGGIGTGAFGRDLQGHFNRWQLQPGFPRVTRVDAASLCLRWEQGGRSGAYRLGESGWDRPLPPGSRQVAVLWPMLSEQVASPDWPVQVVMESWSPVVPHNDAAAALPVAFFDVYVRNTSAAPARLDVALFMPNFLGWRKGAGTVLPTLAEQKPPDDVALQPAPAVWPERANSGNYAEPAEPDPAGGLLTGVMLRRAGYAAPTRDMEGEVLLGVGGGPEVRAQREVCALVAARSGSGAAAPYFLGNAEREFFATGRLPVQERGWRSGTQEVAASAVAGGLTLAPGAEGHFTLVMVWDLPLVEFGSGRTWEKAYTARYGASGTQARRIALDALAQRATWAGQIDAWHRSTLGRGTLGERRRRGACINDLAYVISGGTSWVAKEHPQPGLEPPLLGSGEHFTISEGCDTGYYFCDTFDLWPYAQPAFEANWPHLADLVLQDYLRIAPLTVADARVVTSSGQFTVRKVANKIPHDLGCPAGDPWSFINEYGTDRDSNVWKDHDPEFILSLYLHRKFSSAPAPNDADWSVLRGIADFMIAQDHRHDGLPDHDTLGDSTWDSLHFTGPSPYSGALTLGAWAAFADWSRQRGDAGQAKRFTARLQLGQASFEKYFWNGRYYRSAPNGPQAEWVFSDALFGVLLAESAGFHGLLPPEHVAAHLRRVAERNWHEFGAGAVGPSLLAPPSGPIPARAQVGEVLVGSAWSCIALMDRFGLGAEAGAMAEVVNRTLYQESGLQFRTPAAWTPERTFRSPANLRPLASWHTLWPGEPAK